METEMNILIVEDSRTQAELLEEILKRENYAVFRAEDAAGALRMLRERSYGVILSDIEMPGMNGYELCRKIKDDPATKDIPLILLSVLSDPRDIIRGLECGADNFVTKPFEPDYLLSWIKHHLINRELRRGGGARAGLEFYFGGRKHFLSSDRMQILDILLSTYEAAVKKNRELRDAQKDLERLNSSLENRVAERTAELLREVEAHARTESDLIVAKQREDMVLRTVPAAFFCARQTDGGLSLEWVSEGAAKLCACRQEDLLREPDFWFSRVHPEDLERVRADLGRLAVTGTASTEYRWRVTGEDYRWLLASVSLSDGKVLGLWLDISEKRALELQLRQAQKMEAVGRLAGGVAHDFNNLLTAIDGYADFLLRSMPQEDPRRADVGEIIRAAGTAASLTRQLLAFSRRQIFKPRVVDINSTVLDTQKLLKRLIGENIGVALDLSREECRVKADPGQLEQIVMNLVVNARDAMPDGGKVTLCTENVQLSENYAEMHMDVRPGPYVMLTISDTGRGIPREMAQHIFEPFFSTKDLGKGTGLGLATVYGIVKHSGGNIYVYSEPGLGTTFKIYLPRVAEALTAAAPPPVPAAALRGSETLLVVEDDDGVRGFALRALRESGYTVLEAKNPAEALALCEAHAKEISLVLTDTVMPGMNGYELYGRLRGRCKDVKVVFMSGYTDTELAHVLLSVEQLPFLQKPVSADDLTRKIRETLDAPVPVAAKA